MTRNYTDCNGNRFSFTVYPENNDFFTVTRNGITKTVRIIENGEFCYKLLKTKILARGGAVGLFKWADNYLYNGFCECLVYKVLNYIIDTMAEP